MSRLESLQPGMRVSWWDHLGTVRFVGETVFGAGLWIGVEMDDDQVGKSDGSIKGVVYFTCQPNRGAFMRASALTILSEEHDAHLRAAREVASHRVRENMARWAKHPVTIDPSRTSVLKFIQIKLDRSKIPIDEISFKPFGAQGKPLNGFPVALAKYPHLTSVSLSGNALSDLPNEIAKLVNLEQLRLSDNRFTQAPLALGRLTRLHVLLLDGNALVSLNPNMHKLTQLVVLDLSNNALSSLPHEIGRLSSLEYLFAAGNLLTRVPNSIVSLVQLRALDLQHNQISTLPSLAQLSQLVDLDLGANSLKSLPPGLFHARNLESLDVSHNHLVELPGTLCFLRRLTTLRAGKNPGLVVPTAIQELTSLTVLDVSFNAWSNLDLSLAMDVNEEVVSLKESWVHGLTSLTTLNLSENALNFPPALRSEALRSLHTIHVGGNPFVASLSLVVTPWSAEREEFEPRSKRRRKVRQEALPAIQARRAAQQAQQERLREEEKESERQRVALEQATIANIVPSSAVAPVAVHQAASIDVTPSIISDPTVQSPSPPSPVVEAVAVSSNPAASSAPPIVPPLQLAALGNSQSSVPPPPTADVVVAPTPVAAVQAVPAPTNDGGSGNAGSDSEASVKVVSPELAKKAVPPPDNERTVQVESQNSIAPGTETVVATPAATVEPAKASSPVVPTPAPLATLDTSASMAAGANGMNSSESFGSPPVMRLASASSMPNLPDNDALVTHVKHEALQAVVTPVRRIAPPEGLKERTLQRRNSVLDVRSTDGSSPALSKSESLPTLRALGDSPALAPLTVEPAPAKVRPAPVSSPSSAALAQPLPATEPSAPEATPVVSTPAAPVAETPVIVSATPTPAVATPAPAAPTEPVARRLDMDAAEHTPARPTASVEASTVAAAPGAPSEHPAPAVEHAREHATPSTPSVPSAPLVAAADPAAPHVAHPVEAPAASAPPHTSQPHETAPHEGGAASGPLTEKTVATDATLTGASTAAPSPSTKVADPHVEHPHMSATEPALPTTSSLEASTATPAAPVAPPPPPPPPPAPPAVTVTTADAPAESDSEDDVDEEWKGWPKHFRHCGEFVGADVWRIENMVPVKLTAAEVGRFYKGDSYIVLRTWEDADGELQHFVHFWVGADSTRDEYTTACFAAVNLAQLFGTRSQREDQGSESKEFKAAFVFGLEFLDGGIDSSMRTQHMVEKKTLYLIKGVKHIRVRRVEPDWRALDTDNVYVLDLSHTMYQWNGAGASMREKGKALDFTSKTNTERGGKLSLIIIEEAEHALSEFSPFWVHLGRADGTPAPTPVRSPLREEHGGDEDYEKQAEADTKLYHVSDESGKMALVALAERPLSKAMLKTTDAFILVTAGDVFVWVGKGANDTEKAVAWKLGEQLFEKLDEEWSTVTRVVEGAEPYLFKEHFVDWMPNRIRDRAAQAKNALLKRKISGTKSRPRANTCPEDAKIDVNVLHAHTRPASAEPPISDDGHGSLNVMVFENENAIFTLRDVHHGQFWDRDGVVCVYRYRTVAKDGNTAQTRFLVYFWQGMATDPRLYLSYELSLGAKLKEQFGRDNISLNVIHIDQFKETAHFRSLFPEGIIIHSGHARDRIPVRVQQIFKALGSPPDAEGKAPEDVWNAAKLVPAVPRLYHVRGATATTSTACEVDCVATSLNSGDAFILDCVVGNKATDTVHVWMGGGVNRGEAVLAMSAALTLAAGPDPVDEEDEEEGESEGEDGSEDAEKKEKPFVAPIKTMKEGGESEAFWAALGGKSEYANDAFLADATRDFYLYRTGFGASGFEVVEVFDFTQADLEPAEVAILDARDCVFIWQGAEASERKLARVRLVVAEYLKASATPRPMCPVTVVRAGQEPRLFTCHFHGWHVLGGSHFVDPRHARELSVADGLKAQQKQLREALAAHRCTYSVTGRDAGMVQAMFGCVTCRLPEGSCCLSCAKGCHAGHELTAKAPSAQACVCGFNHTEGKGLCKCMPLTEIEGVATAPM